MKTHYVRPLQEYDPYEHCGHCWTPDPPYTSCGYCPSLVKQTTSDLSETTCITCLKREQEGLYRLKDYLLGALTKAEEDIWITSTSLGLLLYPEATWVTTFAEAAVGGRD